MGALIFIVIVAVIIWGIVKKYADEESNDRKRRPPVWRPPGPGGTRRPPPRSRSLLDELRQLHERDNRDVHDPLKDQQDRTKHIPIDTPDEEPGEKPRPVPVARPREEPVKPPTARPPRLPVPRIRDPWEPRKEKNETSRTSPGPAPKTPTGQEVSRPRPIPVKTPPPRQSAGRPDVPKTFSTSPSNRPTDRRESAKHERSKAILAAYEKKIGGAVWDEHVNRLIKENLAGSEQLLATVRGTDDAVLAVTDRKLMLIRRDNVMAAFDASDRSLSTWNLADVRRIDLVRDWLRCTLTVVADDDPAPPGNTFTYQRLYHDKVEALVEEVRERIAS